MKKIYIFILFVLCSNLTLAQSWRQYTLQTGVITNIPFSFTSSGNSDYKNGNIGILPLNYSSDTSRGFFPLDIVIDPNAYPWRTSIKFNNVSGVLIDPYHVLTAGHAIEFHPYFKTIRFKPGFESNFDPYDYAFAEYFYLLSNYSVGSPYDYAIVKLDRPIGALCGWNGFGYNNDNSFFQNNIFFNPSYPSLSPFTGEYLFNWKGAFNSTGTEYLISARTGYGGMSGSPAFTRINDNNIVYGIITNYGIKFNRITANKFDAINAIINLNTPAQFDLIPLHFDVTPKIIKSGNSIESLSYVLHNYSFENKSNASITVDVYLSTDQQITTSDELLSTYNLQKSFNSKSSELVTQTNSLPLINKSAGTYYVGIIVSDDNNTNNNTTGSLDIATITVTNNDYVTVKGRIVSTQTNSGVSGVTVNGFPISVTTDYNGNYETQVPYGWSGTATPVKTGYDFSNISTAYSNVSQTTITNYSTSRKTFTLSGHIKSPIAQSPISNVKLLGLVNEPYTDANGNYSVNVYYGWSSNINLVKDNIWDFEPYSFSYNKVISNLINNSIGGFHIYGKCYENSGNPISDVELQGFPINVSTDINGDYSIFIDSGWTGTVTPAKNNIVFIPESRDYENLTCTLDMQNYMEFKAINLNLKILLAGAINGNSDTMITVLNYKNYLPLTPPDTLSGFNEPFIYYRDLNECVTQKFFQYHRDIVDWIIIELRDIKNMNTSIDTIAAFLRSDGKVISITGDSVITLNTNILPDNYYIVIRHRNHLSVMSALPIFLSSNSYLYDFSECLEQFYGYDAAVLSNGKFGMYPCDADFNGIINVQDYQLYKYNSVIANTGYLMTDFNLDGNLTGSDFNIFAPLNKKRATTNVPNSTLIKFFNARR